MIKCKEYDGKIPKRIKLSKKPLPFNPYLSGKMLESVALNKPYEYESIFVVYDFET
jgi:hypothetical protein